MLYLLHQAIDRAAERAPNHQAIRFREAALSYAELAERSHALARVLVEEGVRRGDRVGMYLGKGLTSAIAIYGIMRAGGAYVPLDPSAPPARLAFILRDCGIRHLVTEPARAEPVRRLIAQHAADLDCIIGLEAGEPGLARVIPWSEVWSARSGARDTNPMENDLAYVLYTSGSTGVPKGVMHTHRSALSWAEMAAERYGFRSDDRLSNYAPLHFDLSTLDYFSAATAGATTVILPESHVKLPASLSRVLEDEQLTVFYTVPFALVQLLQRGVLAHRNLSSLRWVLFGGEPIPTKHLRELMRLLPAARFCNIYGPTEVNGVTDYPVPTLADGDDEPIPIGRPLGNVEILIVDDAGLPVAPGEPGELLIRSATMMQGYWGRPDLNQKAFFRRRVCDHYEHVFHRTGDLVRERLDGNLEFLGRRDRQVKTRGYRVELDEIESVLSSHGAVEAAAVFGVPDEGGSWRLQAAITLLPGLQATPSELRGHAAAHLPSYAIPEHISIVAEFPRTSTDKIDRLRLRESLSTELVAPTSRSA